MKNRIELLRDMLQDRFREASLVLDVPKNPEASWWLDVALGEQEVTIEWRPAWGFGVSARPDAVFGERSDETYEALEGAYERVKQLLLSGARTAEPRAMTLGELRRHRDISQEELARRLAIRQASVSKMERRGDLLVGTLVELVSAMGGTLEIRAEFEDESIRITFETSPVPGPSPESRPALHGDSAASGGAGTRSSN